jgi:ribosomal protein L3
LVHLLRDLSSALFAAIVVHVVLLQLVDSAKVGEYQPAQQLNIAEMFKAGDNVDVAGTTVGKGFQGEQQQQHSRL